MVIYKAQATYVISINSIFVVFFTGINIVTRMCAHVNFTLLSNSRLSYFISVSGVATNKNRSSSFIKVLEMI